MVLEWGDLFGALIGGLLGILVVYVYHCIRDYMKK